MSIQDIFYSLGIFFMVLGITILVMIIALLWTIKQKITFIHDLVERQVIRLTGNSTDVAMELGSKVASAAVRRVRDAITKKKEDSSI
ncbi:MAG: hypothetical protein AAB478_05420 [Patescibacteria group bacterium]